jgi:hypothetical protein
MDASSGVCVEILQWSSSRPKDNADCNIQCIIRTSTPVSGEGSHWIWQAMDRHWFHVDDQDVVHQFHLDFLHWGHEYHLRLPQIWTRKSKSIVSKPNMPLPKVNYQENHCSLCVSLGLVYALHNYKDGKPHKDMLERAHLFMKEHKPVWLAMKMLRNKLRFQPIVRHPSIVGRMPSFSEKTPITNARTLFCRQSESSAQFAPSCITCRWRDWFLVLRRKDIMDIVDPCCEMLKNVTPDAGIEPATTRLRVVRSADWANRARTFTRRRRSSSISKKKAFCHLSQRQNGISLLPAFVNLVEIWTIRYPDKL